MEISLTLAGTIPVLQLAGRLDVATSPLLEERITPIREDHEGKEGSPRIVFDCSELSYVSSAGLRVFISTQRQLTARGGGVAFAALSKPVRELFHLAGLEELFIIEPSVGDAAVRLGN